MRGQRPDCASWGYRCPPINRSTGCLPGVCRWEIDLGSRRDRAWRRSLCGPFLVREGKLRLGAPRAQGADPGAQARGLQALTAPCEEHRCCLISPEGPEASPSPPQGLGTCRVRGRDALPPAPERILLSRRSRQRSRRPLSPLPVSSSFPSPGRHFARMAMVPVCQRTCVSSVPPARRSPRRRPGLSCSPAGAGAQETASAYPLPGASVSLSVPRAGGPRAVLPVAGVY